MKEHPASEIKSGSESFPYGILPDHERVNGGWKGRTKWKIRDKRRERWGERRKQKSKKLKRNLAWLSVKGSPLSDWHQYKMSTSQVSPSQPLQPPIMAG